MYRAVIRRENETIKTDAGKIYKATLIIGSIGGIVGGLLMSLFGIFLSAEAYLTKIPTHKVEVFFLVSSFLLLALGAHCLDLIEKERRSKRK